MGGENACKIGAAESKKKIFPSIISSFSCITCNAFTGYCRTSFVYMEDTFGEKTTKIQRYLMAGCELISSATSNPLISFVTSESLKTTSYVTPQTCALVVRQTFTLKYIYIFFEI